ncbi:hypothetical protein HK096_004076, partial [Nowakowskiella sp. JEL0078]
MLVIGSDSIVVCDNQILEKPKSESLAVEMLLKLSGHTHQVLTAVTLITTKEVVSFVESTDVVFGELSREEALAYVET